MKRRVTEKTLENKIKKWQHILKLDGWTLRFRFVSPKGFDGEKNVLAMVKHCSPNEKVAEILFNNKYQTYDGFGSSWNIDTLILHELIHIHLFDRADKLEGMLTPEIAENYNSFEEYICDSFAKIIFDIISLEKKPSQ